MVGEDIGGDAQWQVVRLSALLKQSVLSSFLPPSTRPSLESMHNAPLSYPHERTTDSSEAREETQ